LTGAEISLLSDVLHSRRILELHCFGAKDRVLYQSRIRKVFSIMTGHLSNHDNHCPVVLK
ncbi:hypothetical protein J6590_100473, partial [Homalodisca vitripennis]